ncbi:MAG: hypothetical protein Q6362_002095 [Candidatus Wukongarchaeota archaeon]|nr:hypothetical protein [Candidatus Wukongarchaeota archaeon]MDO8128225.1 hypothetical protein [Candidatus Wukongarchaeota archaeon]
MSNVEETVNKIYSWLEEMELKGIIKVGGENRLIVNFGIEDHVFQVHVLVTEKWINAKALIAYVADMPRSEVKKVYRLCLNANFELNEVTYSTDPDQGNVWVEVDMPCGSSFENFKVEFGSIPFGIHHFVTEIVPKIDFSVRDTSYV